MSCIIIHIICAALITGVMTILKIQKSGEIGLIIDSPLDAILYFIVVYAASYGFTATYRTLRNKSMVDDEKKGGE